MASSDLGFRRKATGSEGESMVSDFLISNGYKVLGRNVRLRVGEIDILARKDGVLVIVEVKTVGGDKFGQAIGYVNAKKQDKLRQIAREVSIKYANSENIRIDVAGVDYWSGKIDYVENAVEGR
jgi:putative endonuclease